MKMIETMEEYEQERYLPLETAFLEQVSEYLGSHMDEVRDTCLREWEKALQKAGKRQEQEGVSCSYMSFSILGTSLLLGKPMIQIDFYNEEWVFGSPWERSRMDASFLFRGWERFCADALDDAYFVRSRLRRPMIRPLFFGTMEKAAYLFACCAKYFMGELAGTEAFQALQKAGSMYVTCGMYLDWQERIYGIVPPVDLDDLEKETDLRFREFQRIIYRGRQYQGLNLSMARFSDCLFEKTMLSHVCLQDAKFVRCRFHRVDFADVQMAGADFEDCHFYQCRWERVTTEGMAAGEYFGETVFRGCYFQNLYADECNLSASLWSGTKAEQSSLHATETGDSPWRLVEVKVDGGE